MTPRFGRKPIEQPPLAEIGRALAIALVALLLIAATVVSLMAVVRSLRPAPSPHMPRFGAALASNKSPLKPSVGDFRRAHRPFPGPPDARAAVFFLTATTRSLT